MLKMANQRIQIVILLNKRKMIKTKALQMPKTLPKLLKQTIMIILILIAILNNSSKEMKIKVQKMMRMTMKEVLLRKSAKILKLFYLVGNREKLEKISKGGMLRKEESKMLKIKLEINKRRIIMNKRRTFMMIV